MVIWDKVSNPRQNLLKFLAQAKENANSDLIKNYFRSLYSEFKSESEANNADGYVPGHFNLELKGDTKDWYSGFFQALAYKKLQSFSLIIVAAHQFLAVWDVNAIPADMLNEVMESDLAPNKLGEKLAKKYKDKNKYIFNKALWRNDEILPVLQDTKIINSELSRFEKILAEGKIVRQQITVKNFPKVLKMMSKFFDKPIYSVRAFYSMLHSWNQESVVKFSNRYQDQAVLEAEPIKNIKTSKKLDFKNFVESYYIHLENNESKDEFFAKYDLALDVVDPKFRIQRGIFFTDLYLARFAMWFVKQNIPNLGRDYLVIDPACGSGNLVTNWKSPLEFRHKVISELEPELLYAVERRMKDDELQNGNFTVIPRPDEGEGLNFIDISADAYINKLHKYLMDKGLDEPRRPIAFLCNPPYRGNDDQRAEKPNYEINRDIIELIGKDGASESYNCFLAQMKLICDKAADSGRPANSALLLFTPIGWLSTRAAFQQVQDAVKSSFAFVEGFIVNSKQFFEVTRSFPVAFTIWSYKEPKNLPQDKPVRIHDLFWLTRDKLTSIDWLDLQEVEDKCSILLNDKKSILFDPSLEKPSIQKWIGKSMVENKRDRTKDEIGKANAGGLPRGDRRLTNSKVYGKPLEKVIGFMDDLTPFRTNKGENGIPWFRLNPQFSDCTKNRCFSGPPSHYGYYARDLEEAKQVFLWFALARTFMQCGYPMWADAMMIWVPDISKKYEETVIKLSFAIGFADNECVETIFPAKNPDVKSPESEVSNPMSPTSKNSFWSLVMSKVFLRNGNDISDKLVLSVGELYDEWLKRFTQNSELFVSYEKPYFIGKGLLRKTAGIRQIKDYAEEMGDEKLLALIGNVNNTLKLAKQEFYDLLLDAEKINYFGESKGKHEVNVNLSPFEKVLEKRLILSSLIISNLKDDIDMGRTKFAKIFYLADVACELDLKARYYRKAAGPLDSRALYNKEIGIESLGVAKKLFNIKETLENVKYTPASNIDSYLKIAKNVFGNKLENIDQIIKLFSNMSTREVEKIATLYACWNDLIIDKKQVDEASIIKNFKNWHKNKEKFPNNEILDGLTWLKRHNLLPKGNKKMSHTITKLEDE